MSAAVSRFSARTTGAGKSALDVAVEQDSKGDLTRFLFWLCGKRGVRGADAEDAVQRTFVLAFQRERKGDGWEPRKEAATLYLGRILVDEVLYVRRRSIKRRREEELPEEGEGAAPSELAVAGADEEVAERDELDRLAREVRVTLAAQTNTGLTLRILDALRDGVSGRERLAEHLGVSMEQIIAAFKRIHRRAKKVYGDAGREVP